MCKVLPIWGWVMTEYSVSRDAPKGDTALTCWFLPVYRMLEGDPKDDEVFLSFGRELVVKHFFPSFTCTRVIDSQLILQCYGFSDLNVTR